MIYKGRKTAQISFPLGGIGTGSIGFGGNGRFLDIEIGNEPNKDSCGDFTHFAIRAETSDGVKDARVLMGDLQPPYIGHTERPKYSGYGFGPDRGSMAGLPHFEKHSFRGEFPIAELKLQDQHFPGNVKIEAFNPLIPSNAFDSSLPAAFFSITVKNTAAEPIRYTLAFSARNFFTKTNAIHRYAGEKGMSALFLSNRSVYTDPEYGDLTLATDAEETSWQEYWFRGNWFDSLSVFWHDFSAGGYFKNRRYTGDKSEINQMAADDFATLAAHISLKPGEKKTVRFVLSWNKPFRSNTWEITAPGLTAEKIAEIRTQTWKNYYATQFSDSLHTARYAIKKFSRLRKETCLFRDALFSSTLPPTVKDAVSANLAVLKSPTCLRLEDGSFYAFEGVHAHEGSCEGTCTHVWSYAYALAYLFPELERSARTMEYRYSLHPNGAMGFRVQLPVGTKPTAFRASADGQFGSVLRVYREYMLSADRKWLEDIWPEVKKSIRFAWSKENPDQWDANKDGLMEGRQHHTLDMELFGENAWLSGVYLAGLNAGARLAQMLGDTDAEKEFASIFETGRKKLNVLLYNGRYFYQNIDLTDREMLVRFDTGASLQGQNVIEAYWNEEAGEIKYQIGEGCGIDQVLGQWHADLLGLDRVFDSEKTRCALRSIFENNYISLLREHVNPCRIYGLNDESGTVICTYPEGVRKPVIPVAYAEETMHGFEYEVGSHMLLYGMEDEALTCVNAVRRRYDGERRNPWNEMECGSNYARSLASYALLLAYSGFRCDAPHQALSFSPLNDRNGKWLFAQEGCFGVIAYTPNDVTLRLLYGTLTLRALQIHRSCIGKKVFLKNGKQSVEVFYNDSEDGVSFQKPIFLKAGFILRICL